MRKIGGHFLPRGYLYLAGLPFNLFLLGMATDVDRWLGPRGRLSAAALLFAIVYLLLGGMAAVYSQTFRGRKATQALTAGSLVAFPFYMLAFMADWNVGLAGMVVGVRQAAIMLRSGRAGAVLAPTPGSPASAGMVERLADSIMFTNLMAAFAVLLVKGYHVELGSIANGALLIFLGLSVAGSLRYELGRSAKEWRQFVLPQALLVVGLLAAATPNWRWLSMLLIGCRQLWSAGLVWLDSGGGRRLWNRLVDQPASLLTYSFFGTIMVGAILLSLPTARVGAEGLGGLDALFTATSATCVTGLIVVDTATDLAPFGQVVVLLLIQLGGLGIMTVSTFVALLMGRNIGLREEFVMGQAIGEERRQTALRLIRFIVVATLVIEAFGALILFVQFYDQGFAFGRSAYLAVFHSVSAFCNAGFSLFSDSLMSVSQDGGVPLTIATLIILGGVGFGVLYYAIHYRLRWHVNSVHIRLVLTTSLALWLGGAVLVYLFERHGVLAGLPGWQGAIHAWFLSVTARTAGFNTVDTGALSNPSALLLMGLMFIGAAPGSTGGGIKVTTLAVLVLVVRAVMGGRSEVVCRGRSVPAETIRSAVALTVLAGILAGGASLILLCSEAASGRAVLFEVFSALGTVGLSMGLTAELSPLGKLMITILMFAGRVGPLTLLLLFRPTGQVKVQYPSANVMVG